ncbi:MAG TPA: glycosyl hydrolase family 8 [Solirubrobacteraceae bacterium]|jgi:endoglucanase|nr:glycosyl hydrolase family 8 [Solirubrobacteraceae bacterium]
MRLAAVALVTASLVTLAACGSSSSSAPPADPNVVRSGQFFLRRYVDGHGRVVRRDQGGDTVSEGQAYGMLIAAGLGDWKRFDTIWGWMRSHLRRPDGLLSWRWAGGRVVGSEAATDADLDAARALVVSGCARGRADLRQAGVALGRAVLAHETARRGSQLILAAGPWATGQPVTVNPSYVAPAGLHVLAIASGDRAFTQAADDGRALVAKLSTPLPPDWATVDAGGNATPSGPPGQNVPPQYGFDAARTLVRMAEDPDPAGRKIAAAAWPVFRDQAPGAIVLERNLNGSPAGGTHTPLALVAAAGAARAAGDGQAVSRLLDAAAVQESRQPTYYGSAWVTLGRLLLTTDRLDGACH